MFHSPYLGLVKKAFGRVFYNDFLLNTDDETTYPTDLKLREITGTVTDVFDNNFIKAWRDFAKSQYTGFFSQYIL